MRWSMVLKRARFIANGGLGCERKFGGLSQRIGCGGFVQALHLLA